MHELSAQPSGAAIVHGYAGLATGTPLTTACGGGPVGAPGGAGVPVICAVGVATDAVASVSPGAFLAFSSSSCIALTSDFRMRSERPRPRAASGSFLAPNSRMNTARMINQCHHDNPPMLCLLDLTDGSPSAMDPSLMLYGLFVSDAVPDGSDADSPFELAYLRLPAMDALTPPCRRSETASVTARAPVTRWCGVRESHRAAERKP